MPHLTKRQAALISALVVCATYSNAVLNGWAGDDPLIIETNRRAHSIAAALAAWFSPYWPPPWEAAGTHRPLTILSYSVDWMLAGGRPWLFHAVNVGLHALTTALVVVVAGQWLAPLGALATGLIFAVHPVHVEAVSNVVGRAELLAGCGLLVAILTGRRYRHATRPVAARWWLAATCGVVALSLMSKEHAAIAVAVLAVDHFLDPRPAARPTADLYLAVTALTLAWFFVWRSVAGPYVASGSTSAFFDMSRRERWDMMLPAQLDVVRLLAWPFDLSSDYSQQTVPLRTTWTPLATLGLTTMAALLALGLLVSRRAPAVAFGILIALGSYAPTSNFLFASGVVLAERALYLAVLAPAMVVGWLVLETRGREYHRSVLAAVGVAVVVFAWRSYLRTPFWRTPQTAIIEDAGDHLENYRARLHLADLVRSKRDTARALAEYLASATLAERDPFVRQYTMSSALALRRYGLAIEEARLAQALAPDYPRTGHWLAQARMGAGLLSEAVAGARADVVRHPESPGFAETYLEALAKAGAPRWERLLVQAKIDWLSGKLVQSAARLDSLSADIAHVARSPSLCVDLEVAFLPLRQLNPAVLDRMRQRSDSLGTPCGLPPLNPPS